MADQPAETAADPATAAEATPDAVDGEEQPRELEMDRFGEAFLRQVLHLERVLTSIDRILGPGLEVGPMGAGPGRRMAKVSATGRFRPSYGVAVPGDRIAYEVTVPIDVDFDVELPFDTHHFHAQLLLPLRLTLRLVEPVTLLWEITPPTEDQLTMTLSSEARRSALFQKLSGLEGELRRFLFRYMNRELDKEYVAKACHIDLLALIDGAWPALAAQFLPNSPEDRH